MSVLDWRPRPARLLIAGCPRCTLARADERRARHGEANALRDALRLETENRRQRDEIGRLEIELLKARPKWERSA